MKYKSFGFNPRAEIAFNERGLYNIVNKILLNINLYYLPFYSLLFISKINFFYCF